MRRVVKGALKLAREQNAPADEISELERRLSGQTYRFSLANPELIRLMSERYPFVIALFGFTLTHRTALTLNTTLDIVRSAKTSQTPHDVEAKFDELMAIKSTLKVLAVTAVQAQWRKHALQRARLDPRVYDDVAAKDSYVKKCRLLLAAARRGELTAKLATSGAEAALAAAQAAAASTRAARGADTLPRPTDEQILACYPWQHASTEVSKISDSYIATAIVTVVRQHDRYILLWTEQNVHRGEIVFGDHHGKHAHRMTHNGAELCGWTYTEFNDIGQKTICVKVQTTSFTDESLVHAYDARHRADAKLGRSNTVRRVCLDNIFKDGGPAADNVFLGDGLPLLRFTGRIQLVYDEAECDAACAFLEKVGVVGYDTENVAFIPPYTGLNIDKAAIVQLCPDETVCYIFVLHAWPRCFESFKRLMVNAAVLKIANNVAHDDSMVLSLVDQGMIFFQRPFRS
jgi:hypothetical protein